MTQDPTPYDLLQDQAIEGLQEIVTPYYQPPSEVEHSFPVVGQGVSSEMFQQISRAAGTGVFIQSNAEGAHEPYHLTNLPGGASATNANNQMLLKVAPVTGRAEAAIDGFFHTLLQDMHIDFPPVTTPTTYYLCLTYDPRREEEEQGPIRVEVHTNSLPTTHGRKHIVLWTVQRQPNQLLTDATIQQHKQWLGHVINVWSEDQLPEPTQTEYGTLAVVVNPGSGMTSYPTLYTNRGVHGWHKAGLGPWEPEDFLYGGWTISTPFRTRHRDGGIDIVGALSRVDGSTSNYHRPARVAPEFRPREPVYFTVMASRTPYHRTYALNPNGEITVVWGGDMTGGTLYFNTFIPDYYF